MKKVVPVVTLLIIVLFNACQTGPGLGQNDDASIHETDELPENPLLLHAITSGVLPRDSTMFVIYGNDAAYSYASSHGDDDYPNGAVLYQVNWRQQADEQWAGANVPEKIINIERVAYTANGQPTYTLYQGSPLKKVAVANPGMRLAVIAAQRMAVSP